MKVKTSITISEELLKAIDQHAGIHKNRSDFIEKALWVFIAQVIRNERNAKDLEIINKRADKLNKEAEDVLGYQAVL